MGRFKGFRIFLKGMGFLLFSLVCGMAIVYLLITYFHFDLTHRDAAHLKPLTGVTDYAAPYLPELSLVQDTTIRNVILFIGDGMGISQIAATRYRYFGPRGKLHMERLPVTGLVSTYPAGGELITDSGAAATALATGRKTRRGMISMTPDSIKHLTIMEAMRNAGYATGLVTTSDITDATPAAFASHVLTRKSQVKIARQLIDSRINVLIGGGETFHGAEMGSGEKSRIMEYAETNGYRIFMDKAALLSTEAEYVLGLFEGVSAGLLDKELSFNTKAPTLAESTRKAIELLSKNDKGFMLVVEEEGSDTGSHINRPDFVTRHVKNLDDAIQEALLFARRNKQTLLIVTADHETGGMTFPAAGSHPGAVVAAWATSGHSGQPVPLFAYGPHAIAFTGMLDNTEVPKIIAEKLGLKEFLDNFGYEKNPEK